MSATVPHPAAMPAPRATFWLALALVVAAGLLALALAANNFQARLDSDLLWPQIFLHDLHDPNHPVAGWSFGSATFWFPDYLSLLPLYWLCGNSGLGYPLYITLQFLLTGAMMAWALAATGIAWRKAAVAAFVVVNLVLLTQFIPGHDGWLWLLGIPCDHGGDVPVGFALLALVFGAIRSRTWGRGRTIAYLIICGLGLVADAITLVHWLAPVGIALAWQAWRAKELRPAWWGFVGRTGLALAFTAAVRLGFSSTQTFFFSSFLQYAPTPQNVGKSFRHFLDGVFHCGVFTDHWVLWLLAVAGIGIALGALRQTTSDEREPVRRIAYQAGLLSLLFAFLAPFATVYWINEHSIRYLLNWLMLPGWLLALRVCRWSQSPRWLPGLAAATALAGIAFAVPQIKSEKLFLPEPQGAEELRKFLAANNLHEGLAGFWQMYLLEAEWRFEGPRLGNIADDFYPCFWCNNAFDYFPAAPGGRGPRAPPAPQFIILDGNDPAHPGLDPQPLLGWLHSEKLRVVHVGGYTVALLTPEQTKLAGEQITQAAKILLQGRRDQWLETQLTVQPTTP